MILLVALVVFVCSLLMLLYVSTKQTCSHASETNISWTPAEDEDGTALIRQAGLGQYVKMTMVCDHCGNERKTFGFVKDWAYLPIR